MVGLFHKDIVLPQHNMSQIYTISATKNMCKLKNIISYVTKNSERGIAKGD